MGNQASGIVKKTDQDKKKQKKAITKFAKKLVSMKMSDLVDEFNEQVSNYRPQQQVTLHPQQMSKNRYRDIECVESTRTCIQGRPDDDNYIHANWITAGQQRYIAAQGPLAHTIDDFWLLVATEKVGAIVMLCDLVEEGQRKCADYWPHEDGARQRYGEVDVENVSVGVSTLPQVQVTILRITHGKNTHLLNHYQWLGWPDSGIPEDQILPIRLLDLAKDCVKPVTGSENAHELPAPILIHCSAGVGRTGTLVAIDMARAKLDEGVSNLSAVKLVRELRDLRTHAIQGPSQYLYMNACILQNCVECGAAVDVEVIQKWLEKCHAFLLEYKEATLNR